MTSKKYKKRFMFFAGTTAELIKLFPVIKKFQDEKTPFEIISSGQNDIEKSEIFSYLGLKKSNLSITNGPKKKTTLSLFLWFFKAFFLSLYKIRKYIKNTKKSEIFLIVHGDTLSTLLGSYAGKILGFKIVHVEAGLRSFNIFHPFPEEINRVLTSKIVDISFCPNNWAVKNLKSSKGLKINTISNTLLESLDLAKNVSASDSIKKVLSKKSYFIFVVHRQENIYNLPRLTTFLDDMFLLAENTHCVFILHEPTKVALEKHKMLNKIKEHKNITILPRQSYFDFMKLIDNSKFFITDGGSNQEEAYYFGKPCLILRNHTERIEGLGENVILWKDGENSIVDFGSNYKKFEREPVKYQKAPSEIIYEELLNA